MVKDTVFLGDASESFFDDSEKNLVEFDNKVSARVIGAYIYRIKFSIIDPETNEIDVDEYNANIIKFALEKVATSNTKRIMSSILRVYYGSKTTSEARQEAILLPDFIAKKPTEFDLITSRYGLEIVGINIDDIELSDEEIKLNRLRFEAEVNLKIADDKKKEMIIIAEGEARVLELKGEGLARQVKPLIDAGATYPVVFAYLAENTKWKLLSPTIKSTLLDSGSLKNMIIKMEDMGL